MHTVVRNGNTTFKYERRYTLNMNARERDELMIRMDERVKTVFNQMESFDNMFTNHLHHHEMWENDMKTQLRWGLGVMATIIGGLIAAMRYI